jgi:predicted nuclease of predicted toxin-antitoxin system
MLNKFPLIIVDESMDARISQALREADFNIFCVQEIMPGTDDINIIQFAADRRAYILTEDKDFGDELVFRQSSHFGAMLLRLDGVDIEEKKRLVLMALNKHSEELLNAFSVLNKNKLRIRKK